MDKTALYPRCTRVLNVMNKAWLPHWVAFEERRRILKMLETSSIEQVRQWAKELPRCTDVKCQCASQVYLERGGEKGTAFHTAVYDYLSGKTDVDPGEAIHAYKRFLKWFAKAGIEIVEKELKLVTHIWRVKGTTDVIFRCAARGTGLFIGDWKTSNNMDPLHELQLGAYAGMYLEERGLPWETFDGGLVVRFDKREKAPKRVIDEKWLTREQLKNRFEIYCSLRRPFDFALAHDLLKVGD